MKMFKGKYKCFFFKLTHLANKSYAKCSPYKTCTRKELFHRKKKPLHSMNFQLHGESHSHVNYHSTISVCIIKAVVNKNHRFNFFSCTYATYLNFQKCQREYP